MLGSKTRVSPLEDIYDQRHAYIEHEHVFLKQMLLSNLIKQHTTQHNVVIGYLS